MQGAVPVLQAVKVLDQHVPAAWRIGSNADWQSIVIDQAQPDWPAFFAEQVIAPLWARGYRGFFLDTLDSYHLVKNADVAAQQAGLVAVIRLMRTRFPARAYRST